MTIYHRDARTQANYAQYGIIAGRKAPLGLSGIAGRSATDGVVTWRRTRASIEPNSLILLHLAIRQSLDQWTAGDEEFQAMMACRRQVMLQGNPRMPLCEQEQLMDTFGIQLLHCSREVIRRLLGPHAGEFPSLDANPS